MVPSIGRIVHFNAGAEATENWCAAIVTSVHNPTVVNLVVFATNGKIYPHNASTEGASPGNWRWPPRV